MRVLRLVCGCVALAVAAGATIAQNNVKEQFNDQTFVIKAASAGMHEVQVNTAAKDKAKDGEVKHFAEKMVTDHTKANNELMATAKAAGVGVPTAMLDEHRKDVEKWRNYSGADFDKAFMHHMVMDHEKAVALFEKASKECQNPQLKAFAEKTLPTIKEHLSMARKVEGGVKGSDK